MSTAHAGSPPLQVAITTGEPAGVGPELTLHALALACAGATVRWPDAHFTVLGDAALLAQRAGCVGVDLPALLGTGRVAIAHTPLRVASVAGQLTAANGAYVLALLDAAIAGATAEAAAAGAKLKATAQPTQGINRAGAYHAIVTAPLQKSTINDAGVPFSGHTEYLAQRTGTAQVVMMLSGAGEHPLRVALATTHLPLSAVPGALSIAGLVETLRIIDHDLRCAFGLNAPRILVTGLNPHAGENGYLGREEIEIISPALERARAMDIDARGPYPADTLFQPRYLQDADCVLAMFHDQGLPVLKYATFGAGVNITLGLPIIRTSVDHGTALDLAGTGQADCGSMLEAISCAVQMARHRYR
jgi:4-hydroxythreonine-4-phosphate dehydrogenase